MCSDPSLECKIDGYGGTRCLCLSGLYMEANHCYPVAQLCNILSNDSKISTNDVQLNWTSRIQSLHINQNITWRTTDDTFIGGEMLANQNGIHVSGLIPGQEYIFTVFSKLQAHSYYPETWFSTNFTIETRPATPGKLNESSSQLKSSPYILSFEVSEGRAANYKITLGEKVYGVSKAELTIDELTPDTQYNYTITAYNKHGDSSEVVTGNFTTGPAEITENDVETQVDIPLIAGVTSGVVVAVIILTVVVTVIVRRRKQKRSKNQGSPKMTDTDDNVVVAAGPSASNSSGDIRMIDYRNVNIVDIRNCSPNDNQDLRYYDYIRDSEITPCYEGIYANIGGIQDSTRTENIYNNSAFVNDKY
ncbi:unnamed protein product [Lymnaea stagnalis]|uniref:Fibronectin type-III domain-containing protein n=1 Tax=Lymnaea stagnalis TaxID=6523 RepID=A0AAV2IBE5_LYMST